MVSCNPKPIKKEGKTKSLQQENAFFHITHTSERRKGPNLEVKTYKQPFFTTTGVKNQILKQWRHLLRNNWKNNSITHKFKCQKSYMWRIMQSLNWSKISHSRSSSFGERNLPLPQITKRRKGKWKDSAIYWCVCERGRDVWLFEEEDDVCLNRFPINCHVPALALFY